MFVNEFGAESERIVRLGTAFYPVQTKGLESRGPTSAPLPFVGSLRGHCAPAFFQSFLSKTSARVNHDTIFRNREKGDVSGAVRIGPRISEHLYIVRYQIPLAHCGDFFPVLVVRSVNLREKRHFFLHFHVRPDEVIEAQLLRNAGEIELRARTV